MDLDPVGRTHRIGEAFKDDRAFALKASQLGEDFGVLQEGIGLGLRAVGMLPLVFPPNAVEGFEEVHTVEFIFSQT